MPDIATSLPLEDVLPQDLYSGTVYAQPLTTHSPLEVLTGGKILEIDLWQSRGTTMPEEGDQVLIAEDSDRQPWVVAWWPQGGDDPPGTGPQGEQGPQGPPGATGPAYSLSVVTSLPSSPTDGQECVLDPSGWTIVGTAEVVSDVQWLLRYRSSTGKWHLIGGDPLIVKVDTAESKTSGTTYANLPTAGPAIRVGVVGDYLVECGCFAASLAAIDGWMSYDIGTSGVGNAADTDGVRTLNNSLGQLALRSTPRRQTISTANHYFYAKYKWANGAIVFSNRFIRILPIRLG